MNYWYMYATIWVKLRKEYGVEKHEWIFLKWGEKVQPTDLKSSVYFKQDNMKKNYTLKH